jgi:hypothetical protein
MTPDDVCKEYSARPIKLHVRDLGSVILIEGTREALEFLVSWSLRKARLRMTGSRSGLKGREIISSARVRREASIFTAWNLWVTKTHALARLLIRSVM